MRMTASWSGLPLERPNTRLWRDDPRPLASSPLIVEARLSPSNLSSSLRTRSDDGACSGNRGVWPAHPRQQGDRAASAPGQVESHLGRTRLTSDAPYKGLLLGISASTKGEPGWPPLALFRALLLATWHDLSDVRLAEALD